LSYLLGAAFIIAGVFCLVFLDKAADFSAALTRARGWSTPFMNDWDMALADAVVLMGVGIGFLAAAMRPVATQSVATSSGALLASLFGFALSSAVIWVVSRETRDAGGSRDVVTSTDEWVWATLGAAIALLCSSLLIAFLLTGLLARVGDLSSTVVSAAFFVTAGATIFTSAGLLVRPTLIPDRPLVGLVIRIGALIVGLAWVAYGAAHLWPAS